MPGRSRRQGTRGARGRGVNGRTRVYAVFGWPVAHTRSPALHNAAFRTAGINAVYVALPVAPSELGAALRGARALGVSGINLTIPHKERCLPYLDGVSPEARAVRAVNTIVVRRGRLIGHNTDGLGFLRAVRRLRGVRLARSRVLLLGAGSTARTIGWVLTRQGISHLTIANRTLARAQRLAVELRRGGARCPIEVVSWTRTTVGRVLPRVELVVQATALGLRAGDPLPVPASALHRGVTVVDVVYRPGGTRFLRAAQACGARVCDGAEMLLQQAALAFELWTGRRAPVATMRQALRRALQDKP